MVFMSCAMTSVLELTLELSDGPKITAG